MKNLTNRLAAIALLPVRTVFALEASAQNRERASFADFDVNEDEFQAKRRGGRRGQ